MDHPSRTADDEADQDNALEDTFPASDPLSTGNPAGGITGSPQDPPARAPFEPPPDPNEPVPPPPGMGPQEVPPAVELPPPMSVPGTEPPPMTA